MTLVVDASVALKWALPEEGAASAAALLTERLIAPDIWIVEVGNALWRRSLAGEFPQPVAASLLSELQAAPVTSVGIHGLTTAALSLAFDLKHPIYDCLYLACAIAAGAPMVTADTRFFKATRKSEHAARIQLLGS